MKTVRHLFILRRAMRWGVAALALLLTTASSCYDDHHHILDRNPPPGLGSLIVDNHTYNDISVFINGQAFPETKDGDAHAYDLQPGVYRVVLEEQGGHQSFRDDIDILAGANTVLDVANGDGVTYDVVVYFN